MTAYYQYKNNLAFWLNLAHLSIDVTPINKILTTSSKLVLLQMYLSPKTRKKFFQQLETEKMSRARKESFLLVE
jgi:hypothetical protein